MIQLTQCPAWPQSLLGGEKYVYLPKTTQYLSCSIQSTCACSSRPCPGVQWDSLSSFWWGGPGCHQFASGFLCSRCTALVAVHNCKFSGHSSGKLGASYRDTVGHSEWASLAHKLAGSGEIMRLSSLPPIKVFTATKEEGQWTYRGAKFSRRQWTLAPSSHSPRLMSTIQI